MTAFGKIIRLIEPPIELFTSTIIFTYYELAILVSHDLLVTLGFAICRKICEF